MPIPIARTAAAVDLTAGTSSLPPGRRVIPPPRMSSSIPLRRLCAGRSRRHGPARLLCHIPNRPRAETQIRICQRLYIPFARSNRQPLRNHRRPPCRRFPPAGYAPAFPLRATHGAPERLRRMRFLRRPLCPVSRLAFVAFLLAYAGTYSRRSRGVPRARRRRGIATSDSSMPPARRRALGRSRPRHIRRINDCRAGAAPGALG